MQQATSRLKQKEAIIKEQQHQNEIEKKQQKFKFENDSREQENRLRMENTRLEMEHVSEENRIKSAETKIIETEYLKEPDLDQHLQLSSRIDRCSERVEDWVGHALENQKGPR